MRIDLTPEQAQLIQGRMRTGVYTNEQEVIDDALGVLERLAHDAALEDDILASVGIENVRANAQEGVAQLARGEGITLRDDDELQAFFDDIKARGRKRLAERNKVRPD